MNRLIECIVKNNSGDTPVWFMRQAGRYLPEFMKIRKQNLDFIKLCLNSELAKEITIQPVKRFNIDAAIIFSDILMIPYGLGQNVKFKKGYGPLLENINLKKIMKTDSTDFTRKLKPVYVAIEKVKKEINGKSLIGFVGAPWTLLLYMFNLESPKRNFNFDKIKNDKDLNDNLIEKLINVTCLHIKNQVDAGANVIQIFDSWAGLLPEEQLEKFCYKPTTKIVNFTKSLNVPVICFPRGIKKKYAEYTNKVKPDCLSIDYEVDPLWIKEEIKSVAIQGGLDPKILLEKDEVIEKEVKKYLDIFRDQPYVFNLGHGVLPQTNPEKIKFVTNLVRNYK
ncbi:MAG: uroporphyrinogen decarboxylase [Gammaproteobacteria bacterium TMED34]|nr:MAG: uroporphyrinogen decarboxylase [Gammaproteobacteria bacterium TMED34]